MKISENGQGALLMMASMACFTINDTFMKSMAGQIPLFELIVLRGIGSIATLLVIAQAMGMLHLRFPPRDRWFVAIRSVAEIGSTLCFLIALFHMPLANVSAIFQALPLAIALAAIVFLRERVDWVQWVVITVGFVGVVLIVQPGGAGFNIYSLLALGSVACVVVRDLVVRPMSAEVPSLIVALGAAVAVTCASGLLSLADTWVRPSPVQAGAILGAMVFLVAGYFCSVMAMRRGNLGFVAPFRYTGLLWALLLGHLVYGDWPDGWTLTGAAIIVASGIFMLWCERQGKGQPIAHSAASAEA